MNKRSGFTIVELLVVIVIIGILATITIVGYTGVSSKATAASLQSDLAGASVQLKMYQAEYGLYPTMNASNCPTSPTADTKYCLKNTPGNILSYSSSSPFTTFTLDATKGDIKYRITNNTPPALVAALVLPPNTTDNGDGTYTTKIYSDASDGNIQGDTGCGSYVFNETRHWLAISATWTGEDCMSLNRSFIKFTLQSIPVTVNNASLFVKYYDGDSSNATGSVIVDHINDYDLLDAGDWNISSYTSGIGNIFTTTSIGENYYSINVTSRVQADKSASRVNSSYRLKHSNEDNGGFYGMYFSESGSNSAPYLSVTWTP